MIKYQGKRSVKEQICVSFLADIFTSFTTPKPPPRRRVIIIIPHTFVAPPDVLYLAMTFDPESYCPTIIFSIVGGMNMEETSNHEP